MFPGYYDVVAIGKGVKVDRFSCIDIGSLEVPLNDLGYGVLLFRFRVSDGIVIYLYRGGSGFSSDPLNVSIIERGGHAVIPFKVDPGLYSARICGLYGESVVDGLIYIYSYNNPYLKLKLYRSVGSYPVGIADYGIYYDPGTDTYRSYSYRADKVMGVSILDNFYSRETYTGLALQLNVVATLDNDPSKALLIQSVVAVANISSSRNADRLIVSFTSAIFNFTNFCSLIDESLISGRGVVQGYGRSILCPTGGMFYTYSIANTYTVDKSRLPLLIVQTIEIDGDTILFGYGVKDVVEFRYIDNVTLKGYSDLSITVNGSGSSIAIPHMIEYVIAGPNALRPQATPSSLNISMALFIHKNGEWTIPKAAWSIGMLTFERVSNVGLARYGSGYVYYSTGMLNQIMLWNPINTSVVITDPLIYYISFDGSGYPNLSRYMLALENGTLKNILIIDPYSRYKLIGYREKLFGYLKIVEASYILEKLFRIKLYNLNGSEIPVVFMEGIELERNKYIWLASNLRDINRITYNGLNISVDRIIINRSDLNIIIKIADKEILVTDILGLPAPFSNITLKCGGKRFTSNTTNYSGYTTVSIPLEYQCTSIKPFLGIYSVILIISVVTAIATAVITKYKRH